jgi:ADP-ribosylglycohydrolase
MTLNQEEFKSKVLGCWLGKNIGGTLGAPFEWKRQVNNVTFYTQDLHGEAMPNDDLDIQLLWLCAMEEKGIYPNSRLLAEYWCLYVTPHWAEYGTGKINLRSGLPPPLSGTFRNAYKHSCGAYIRSEIWACIAPGLPHIAAKYAIEDALLDHGNGEGTYAEVFMAALESAAFVISDLNQLIEIGLSYIPADCGVAKAVHMVVDCHKRKKTWLETREQLLREHRGGLSLGNTSLEDQKKGFGEGVRGYDVPSNIGITLIGLLWGGEDFGQVQCIAVNCGEDTDCTAATAGSVWGIIHGAAAIPQKWIDPIGRGIKTVCLNLGELGYFGQQLPANVDNLTERTMRIARQVLASHGFENMCSAEPTSLKDVTPEKLMGGKTLASLEICMRGPRFDFDCFSVYVDYGDEPVIKPGQPKTVKFTIVNTFKYQSNLGFHWYLPAGWEVSPGADGYALSFTSWFGAPVTLEYQLKTPVVTQPTSRAVFEITIQGRPTVMLVPITLINGTI